jgi:hypothetical protein
MRIATLGPFTVPVDILFSVQDLEMTPLKNALWLGERAGCFARVQGLKTVLQTFDPWATDSGSLFAVD